MFCKNCGKELADNALFCPVCGTKKAEAPDMGNVQDVDRCLGTKDPDMAPQIEDQESGKKEPSKNIISRIWNSTLFTKAAIKFGNILEILEGIIFLILAGALFSEGGFWGVAFGIVFVLAGAGGCITGAISLLSRKKNNDEGGALDSVAINKKKRNLCIGIVVIAIALVVVAKTGGGTYSLVRAISFDDIGEETIGEIVDENIKSPEWSQKKLDGSSKLVYVEGYCPSYGETIRIEFYYEEKGDTYEVSLHGMYLPDSDEKFNSLETAIAWAALYN